MATEVVMPQMGESIAEGTITKWLVTVGSQVERDQPLFEISTDKVDAEIPSPAAGTLLEIRHNAGETVAVGAVVGVIGAEGEEPAKPPQVEIDGATAPASTDAKPPQVEIDGAAAAKAPAPDAKPPQVEIDSAARTAAPGSLEERVRTLSSPVVRNIARAHGIDVARVPGTGVHGRVTKQD